MHAGTGGRFSSGVRSKSRASMKSSSLRVSRAWLLPVLFCGFLGTCFGGQYYPLNDLNTQVWSPLAPDSAVAYWTATPTGTLYTDWSAYIAQGTCQSQDATNGCNFIFNNPNQNRNSVTVKVNQFMQTPSVRGAGCSFVSYASNFAVGNAFLATQDGLWNAFNSSTSPIGYNVSAFATLNVTYSREGDWLYGLNTSGAYSFIFFNSGGQNQSGTSNAGANTNLSYAFAAYDASEPICKSARPSGGYPVDNITSTADGGGAAKNETLTVTIERSIKYVELAPIAAFTNASCIAYQLLAQPQSPVPGTTSAYGGYYTFNSTTGLYLQDTSLTERGVSAFLLDEDAAEQWLMANIVPGSSVQTQGAVCTQDVTSHGYGQSANANVVYSSNSTAPGTMDVNGSQIMIPPWQTCQVVANDLDPTKNYILFAANDPQQSMKKDIAKVSLRIAARSEGSCSALLFPKISDKDSVAGVMNTFLSDLTIKSGDTAAVLQPSTSTAANAPFAYGVQHSLGVLLGPSTSSSSSHAGAIAGGVVGGVVCLALIAVGLLFCTGRWKPFQSEEKTAIHSSGQEDPMFDHYNVDSGQRRWTEVADFSTIMATGDSKGYFTDTSVNTTTQGTNKDSEPSSIRTLPNPTAIPSSPPIPEERIQTSPLPASLEPKSPGQRRVGIPSISSYQPDRRGYNPKAHTPPVPIQDVVSAPTIGGPGAMAHKVHTLDFSDAKEAFGIYPGQLQAAIPNVITKESVASEATSISTDTSSGGGLKDTWKVDAKHLMCKVADGMPIILGEGGFGKVYLGELFGSQDVAVKVVQSKNEEHRANFIREIHTLKACFNPNIVQFIGAVFNGPDIFLIMEYMPGENLYSLLESSRSAEFGWNRLGKRIILDIAKAVVYLHSIGIIHFDIKTPNVLLTRNYRAKLADIGLGKFLAGEGSLTAKAEQGTLYWSAPEQKMGQNCSFSADIFSLGVVLWEIVTTEPPTPERRRAVRPDEAPQSIIDLIHSTTRGPLERPTAVEFHNIVQKAIEDPEAV